jgi:hypothetical protein
VGQILGSWASFEVSGLVEGGVDLGLPRRLPSGSAVGSVTVAGLVPVFVGLPRVAVGRTQGCCTWLMYLIARGPGAD